MSTSMENTSTGQGQEQGQGQKYEPAMIRRPLDNCPECGSWQLSPVVDADGGLVHFLCGSCSRCWHVAFGFVRRVAPETCAACPQSELCAAAYAKDQASA